MLLNRKKYRKFSKIQISRASFLLLLIFLLDRFYTNTELIVEAIRKHCNVMIPSSVDAYKLVPLSEVDNTLNINGFVYSDDVPSK